MEKYLIGAFKFLNKYLYKRFFPAYRILYFIYKSCNDRKKIRALKSIVKPGMAILDIGANVGFYSILFSRLVGDTGKVYAFEPDKLNFFRLRENTKKYKNIIINNLAVSDKSGDILFYPSGDLNVNGKTYDSGENRKPLKIKCVSIDDYLGDSEKIDLVKMDIEGYEYFALQGMVRLLERSDKITILTEFWPYAIKKSGIQPDLLIKFLEGIGFEIKFEKDTRPDELAIKSEEPFFLTDLFAFKKKMNSAKI